MKDRINYKRIYFVLMVLFVLVYIFQNYSVFIQDKSRLFHGDTPKHLDIVYRAYQRFQREGFFNSVLHLHTSFYPPLVYYLTFVLFEIFGVSFKVVFFTNYIFIVILALSMYFIGVHYGNEELGFLCGFASLTTGDIVVISRHYLLDMPLTAMAALSLFLLIKSRRFSDRLYTYLFFIVFGLGMMTKSTLFLYLFIPICIVLYRFFKDMKREKPAVGAFWRVVVMLMPVLAAGVGVVIAYYKLGIGWKANYHGESNIWLRFFLSSLPLTALLAYTFLVKGLDNRTITVLRGVTIFFLIVWSHYGMFLAQVLKGSWYLRTGGLMTYEMGIYLEWLKYSLGLNMIVLAFVGSVVLLVMKKMKDDWLLLIGGIIGSLVIFYIMPTKDFRFYLPIAVFLIPLGIAWIKHVRLKPVKVLVALAVIYFGVFGWIGWMFEDSVLAKPVKKLGMLRYGPLREEFPVKSITDQVRIMWGNHRSLLIVSHSVTIPRAVMILYKIPVLYEYAENRRLLITTYRMKPRFPDYQGGLTIDTGRFKSGIAHTKPCLDLDDYERVIIVVTYIEGEKRAFAGEINSVLGNLFGNRNMKALQKVRLMYNIQRREIITDIYCVEITGVRE